MHKFIEIQPEELDINVFRTVGREWMLLSAGKERSMNTMTASWGGMGVLWNANVAFVFVRPSRYTYEFIEREPHFSCSFFGGGYRRELMLCGSKSGREIDKTEETGLTPRFDAPAAPYFDEAELALICKKMYHQDIDPAFFLDPAIAVHYEKDGYHRLYVGEIVKILRRMAL